MRTVAIINRMPKKIPIKKNPPYIPINSGFESALDSTVPLYRPAAYSFAVDTQGIVVPDGTELNELFNLQKEVLGDKAAVIQHYYGFDSDAGEAEERTPSISENESYLSLPGGSYRSSA